MTRHTYQFEVFKANGKHKMKISHIIAEFSIKMTNALFWNLYHLTFSSYPRMFISTAIYCALIQLIKG